MRMNETKVQQIPKIVKPAQNVALWNMGAIVFLLDEHSTPLQRTSNTAWGRFRSSLHRMQDFHLYEEQSRVF